MNKQINAKVLDSIIFISNLNFLDDLQIIHGLFAD